MFLDTVKWDGVCDMMMCLINSSHIIASMSCVSLSLLFSLQLLQFTETIKYSLDDDHGWMTQTIPPPS